MKGLAVVPLIAAALGLAQEAPPVFTASTNNVVVDAAVIGDARASTGLQRGDFILLENGQPIPIAGIAHDQLPLDIVLVCQSPIRGPGAQVNNYGRAEKLRDHDGKEIPEDVTHYGFADQRIPQRLMNAAANAVAGARPGDRVAMVVYGADPRIELRFTDDRKAIAAAIKRFGDAEKADENIILTSEGLAIEYAVRMIGDAERGDPQARTSRRRLIIMISNVLGSGVRYADEPIIRRLWDRDIVFSAIEDFPPSRSTETVQRSAGGESQTVLFQRYPPVHIAQATGGDRIVPLDPQHPPDLLTPIRQRYTLWFDQPTGVSPGESRSIKVDLSETARRRFSDAVVRAREGYVTR